MKSFGSETEIRSELVPLAVKEAEKKAFAFEREDAVIIGDTVEDIRCAKEAGVKCIAVATGKETSEELSSKNPDYCFEDFAEIGDILSEIEK